MKRSIRINVANRFFARSWRAALVVALVVATLGLAWPSAAQATIIYSDDFSGSGSANLNGTTPDITPTGTETWTAHTTFKADGYNAEWWNGYRTATLPFVPGSGKVYTLSVGVLNADPYNNENYNSDPIGFGFDAGPQFKFYDDGGGTLYTTGGPLGDVNEGGYGKGAIQVDIVLDTGSAAWKVEYFVGGASVRGPETYSTNPNVTNIILWKDWMSGLWDDLTLNVIPEPGTLVLLALGGLGILARRRRG
jgi:hypothetical protein